MQLLCTLAKIFELSLTTLPAILEAVAERQELLRNKFSPSTPNKVSFVQSFEQLHPRAVSVVIDPIQSVKGKVVIDAFR